MNSFEDSVGFSVSTPACPPTFDNSNVVSEYFDTWECAMLENNLDE